MLLNNQKSYSGNGIFFIPGISSSGEGRMQIHIIAVGKIKEEFLREGVAEYEKRLRPYLNLKIVELTEEKRSVFRFTVSGEDRDSEGRGKDSCSGPFRLICRRPRCRGDKLVKS